MRRLSTLKPHPKQSVYFPPPSPSEVADLAAEIKRDGQRVPAEILPDGTIICGHSRKLALELLRAETMKCEIRDDLLYEGADAVEHRLVEDNTNRRQLGRLTQTRAYEAMKRLENKYGNDHGYQATRDYLATKFKVCGRTLDRWMQVLDTPIEVQNAWDTGALSLRDVMRVLRSSTTAQKRIAARIAAGDSPKAVVTKHAAAASQQIRRIGAAVQSVVRSVERLQESIDTDPDASKLCAYREYSPTIRAAQQRLDELHAQLARADDGAE